jgi:hypothetical protein
MFNKALIPLYVFFLSSCGSSSDDQETIHIEEKITLESNLIGKWSTGCIDSTSVSASFLNNGNTSTYEKEYDNSDCTGEISWQKEYEYTYVLGGIFYTEDNKEAIEIDFYYYDNDGNEHIDYSLVFIDSENILYVGGDSEPNDGSHPSLRHSILNYQSPFYKE